MSEASYEYFGTLAEVCPDPTLASGRMPFQREAERAILLDVVTKLSLSPRDRLLEIGCGPGNLLIPLSFMVSEAVGVDHPRCLHALRSRFTAGTLSLVPGNFLELQELDLGTFDAVLVYSVLHYLANVKEVLSFAVKAAGLLVPGGRLLLGDIPNVSKKERFLRSEEGHVIDAEWKRLCALAPARPVECRDACLVVLDDSAVLGLLGELRGRGLNTYVLPQSPDLPFSGSREDILVKRVR